MIYLRSSVFHSSAGIANLPEGKYFSTCTISSGFARYRIDCGIEIVRQILFHFQKCLDQPRVI